MFARLTSWFAKPPPVEFRDAELGVLTLDCGVGLVRPTVMGELRFIVAGTETAPDSRLLGAVRALLPRFPDTEHAAMEFLRSHEFDVARAHLDFYSFEFLWEDKPDDFAFEFLANGDDSRLWRVEFVRGHVSKTGFDD